MGKKAEQFLQESKENNVIQKQQALKIHKNKKKLLFQLIGYFIMITGVLYTVYKFDNQNIDLSSTIILVLISLFFGGIFILIGKHYG